MIINLDEIRKAIVNLNLIHIPSDCIWNTPINKIEIGKRIRSNRHLLGYSAKSFGKIIGVGKNIVLNWENGKTLPSDSSLENLSFAFHTTIEFILYGDENPPLAKFNVLDKIKTDFITKIRIIRKRLQLSYYDMSDILGINHEALYKWESGQCLPGYINMKQCETRLNLFIKSYYREHNTKGLPKQIDVKNERSAFVEKLKSTRILLNITIEDLAIKLDLGRSNIFRWENGKHIPTNKSMKKILLTLNELIVSHTQFKHKIYSDLANDSSKFIEKLIEYKAFRNFSYKQLSNTFNVCSVSLIRWVNKTTKPSYHKAYIVSKHILENYTPDVRDKKSLGRRLQLIRLQRNQSHRDFARLYKTNIKSVILWELGSITPDMNTLWSIAIDSNISLKHLILGSDKIKLPSQSDFFNMNSTYFVKAKNRKIRLARTNNDSNSTVLKKTKGRPRSMRLRRTHSKSKT
jgi:transcriptional regulator with XRE-family HTH domain